MEINKLNNKINAAVFFALCLLFRLRLVSLHNPLDKYMTTQVLCTIYIQ